MINDIIKKKFIEVNNMPPGIGAIIALIGLAIIAFLVVRPDKKLFSQKKKTEKKDTQ